LSIEPQEVILLPITVLEDILNVVANAVNVN
jgi:hypothetical protein